MISFFRSIFMGLIACCVLGATCSCSGDSGDTRDFRRTLASAERGDADAQAKVAWMFLRGVGVKEDEDKALEWYEKAAAQGNAEGQFGVAVIRDLAYGQPTRAAELYGKAAAQGHANAMLNLGHMYQKGQGVPASAEKAIEWYERAAENGNAAGWVNMGVMYENGKGVKKDLKKAETCYRRACDKEDKGACNALKKLGNSGMRELVSVPVMLPRLPAK